MATTFFDTGGNYDVKRYEGLAVYLLAFCIFAALISFEKYYMTLANILCILGVIWQFVLIYLLITIQYELKSETNVESIIIEWLELYWYDLVVYLKKLIYEDFYA